MSDDDSDEEVPVADYLASIRSSVYRGPVLSGKNISFDRIAAFNVERPPGSYFEMQLRKEDVKFFNEDFAHTNNVPEEPPETPQRARDRTKQNLWRDAQRSLLNIARVYRELGKALDQPSAKERQKHHFASLGWLVRRELALLQDKRFRSLTRGTGASNRDVAVPKPPFLSDANLAGMKEVKAAQDAVDNLKKRPRYTSPRRDERWRPSERRGGGGYGQQRFFRDGGSHQGRGYRGGHGKGRGGYRHKSRSPHRAPRPQGPLGEKH